MYFVGRITIKINVHGNKKLSNPKKKSYGEFGGHRISYSHNNDSHFTKIALGFALISIIEW